ncbi:MAG: DPP IV N-terminal domain-containing protein [Phycisphaerales bacterium]
MHRDRLRILAAAIACAASASLCHAQWIPAEQLPGADKVREIGEAGGRGSGGAGRISEVRWDADAGVLWYRYAGNWRSIPLAGGAPTEGGEPPAAPETKRTPREPRGGRAQQAARVPSPDGRWAAVFDKSNVHLEPVKEGGERIEVTTEGVGKRKFGSADWVYGEELDQTSAMWWSPDGSKLAYYDFDERPVKDYYLLGGLTQTRTRPMVAGYPKPGEDNSIAKLEIFDVASRKRIPVDVGPDATQYVYGARWTPSGDGLLFFRTNRRQDTLDLVLADPATGASRVVLTEKQPNWQKNSPTLRFLEDGHRFIWESESTGWANWQLWDLQKGKIADLTADSFPVEEIVRIDEPGGWLYYTARSSETAINPQLHRARLDGSARERLTREDMHWSGFQISPDGKFFVATKEFVDMPPSTGLYRADGTLVAALTKPGQGPWDKLGLEKPEFLRITAADGKTELYGVLYKPAGFDPAKKYPLVVQPYGGPAFATISTRYQPVEADVGYGVLVARMDNRGTPGRGKAFEDATYLKLGGPDVDDQAQLVKELGKRPYVDAGRVAVTGHSYGGYMTLMLLLRYPELFQVGVAGAPPSDWRQYDTIYTERYMRTPQENEAGYDAGSAVKLAGRLKGRVLLLHGMVDDNVHPANSMSIADAWQRANIPFEMMVFPTSNHGIFVPAHESAKWSYILRNLGLWTPAPVGGAPAAAATAAAAEPMKAK